MMQTYSGTLRGDRIEWDADAPPGDGVRVVVTVQEPPQERPFRNTQLEAILKRLAATEIGQVIPDPAAWQKEIRRDRPLPGREE